MGDVSEGGEALYGDDISHRSLEDLHPALPTLYPSTLVDHLYNLRFPEYGCAAHSQAMKCPD